MIRGVSFGLKENEICHIQGVNGSGKTSLLKIILGIVEPTKGEVHRKENLKIHDFDYLGNSHKDLPIWQYTKRAIHTNASQELKKIIKSQL